MRAFLTRLVVFSLIAASVTAFSAESSGAMDNAPTDEVIARIHTTDTRRIRALGQEHELLYYIWRENYAVIRVEANLLPPDAIIDRESTMALRAASRPFRGTGTIPDRPCYRTVEQTYSDLSSLAATRPDLALWIDFGDSWEKTRNQGGYDLQALVLTNHEIPGPKPVFMVIGASHARELTTAESVARFAEMLLADYGSDPDVTWMLDYLELHIIPHHNPDGRKMAEAECSGGCFPSWRKNTSQDYCGASSSDRGADLNRNSGSSFWGGPFSGAGQCSVTYRGPAAASEPETADLESYAASVFPDFRSVPSDDYTTPADFEADGVFISVHSAGDIVFYPWEGSNQPPPNLTGLQSMAQKLGLSTSFAACQNCFLGPASGTNVDFMYETLGIPAFTFEIGTSFGETCQAFETTVLQNTINGLKNALRHTRRSYQTPLGPDMVQVEFTASPEGGTLTGEADDTRRAVFGGGEPLQPSQPISQVRYTINLPPWLAENSYPMLAADGAFDETVESVMAELDQSQLTGTRMIFVYAEDADGNIGPPSAVWVNRNSLNFGSGFEPAL